MLLKYRESRPPKLLGEDRTAARPDQIQAPLGTPKGKVVERVK
jgi:hypothetical protein